MNINIKMTGVELTPALDQYVRYKLAKAKKLINESNGEALAEIEIGKVTDHHKSGPIFRAEINLEIPGQNLKRATETHYDLYSAILASRDDLIRQIKTEQKKQQTKVRTGGRRFKDMLRRFRD